MSGLSRYLFILGPAGGEILEVDPAKSRVTVGVAEYYHCKVLPEGASAEVVPVREVLVEYVRKAVVMSDDPSRRSMAVFVCADALEGDDQAWLDAVPMSVLTSLFPQEVASDG